MGREGQGPLQESTLHLYYPFKFSLLRSHAFNKCGEIKEHCASFRLVLPLRLSEAKHKMEIENDASGQPKKKQPPPLCCVV